MEKKFFSENRYSKKDYLVAFVIFYSNITYIPLLTSNELIRPLTYFLWGLLFIILNIDFKIHKNMLPYVVCVFSFDLYIMIMEIITNDHYILSSFVYAVNLCFFVLIIGINLTKTLTTKKLIFYFKSYLYSGVLLGIIIYFKFFKDVNWVNSVSYIVGQKNGISMIFLISIILTVYIKNYLNKISIFVMIGIFCMLLVMLKSRTVILGLFLAIGFLFLRMSARKKILVLFLFGIVTLYLVYFTNVPEYIIYNVLLNNRQDLGIDAVTSGRLSHVADFTNHFKESPLIGRGSYYLESFPLASLMSFGLLGSLPLFILALLPSITIHMHKISFKNIKLNELLIIIWVVYIFNGFFEELAPFGPGVKSYMLWLLTGVYIGLSSRNKENNI